MPSRYDTIGIGYNRTRRADPYIADRLLYHLRPAPDEMYLDIGCGTGNYTIALHQKGIRFTGVEPSDTMRAVAESCSTTIQWRAGNAENIPLADETVAGVIAVLTIHHWTDPDRSFREIHRVVRPGGRFVLFTSTPHQMEGYWLRHYFPRMMQDSIRQMPSLPVVETALRNAGFAITDTEQYFVQPDLQDLFLYAGKHDPALYLRPDVRQGISSFSALAHREEVEQGLRQLDEDIQTGAIDSIAQRYRNDTGDYLFVVGEKTAIL